MVLLFVKGVYIYSDCYSVCHYCTSAVSHFPLCVLLVSCKSTPFILACLVQFFSNLRLVLTDSLTLLPFYQLLLLNFIPSVILISSGFSPFIYIVVAFLLNSPLIFTASYLLSALYITSNVSSVGPTSQLSHKHSAPTTLIFLIVISHSTLNPCTLHVSLSQVLFVPAFWYSCVDALYGCQVIHVCYSLCGTHPPSPLAHPFLHWPQRNGSSLDPSP